MSGDAGYSESKSSARDERRDSALEIGAAVEARYGGKLEWCEGKVCRIHSNGTYSVEYNDGRKERRVRRQLIRLLGENKQRKMKSRSRRKKARSNSVRKHGKRKSDDRNELRKGMAVEVRLRANGKAMWFEGKITRVHSNNTFDILYSNGDKERGVEKVFIRKPKAMSKANQHVRNADRSRKPSKWVRWKPKAAGTNANGGDQNIQVGTLIEAKYGGKMKWFKGKIYRLNPNGTYDIRYLDGDFERGVKAHLVRKINTSTYSDTNDDEGDGDDDFDVCESDNDSDIGEEFDVSVHSDSDGGIDDEFDESTSIESQVSNNDDDTDNDDVESIVQARQQVDIVRLKTMRFLTLSDRCKSVATLDFDGC